MGERLPRASARYTHVCRVVPSADTMARAMIPVHTRAAVCSAALRVSCPYFIFCMPYRGMGRVACTWQGGAAPTLSRI